MPVHPRALREASLSGTGGRWPRTGATRTPNARRPKPRGPGATDSRLGSLDGVALPRCQPAGDGGGPERWVKISPPGVMRSKPQTPRAGRWREDEPAVLFPDCLGLARGRGPWVLRNPGVPRALGPFEGAKSSNPRAKSCRENDGAWLFVKSIGGSNAYRSSPRKRGPRVTNRIYRLALDSRLRGNERWRRPTRSAIRRNSPPATSPPLPSSRRSRAPPPGAAGRTASPRETDA